MKGGHKQNFYCKLNLEIKYFLLEKRFNFRD